MSQLPDLLDLSITLTPPRQDSPPEVLATITLGAFGRVSGSGMRWLTV